MYEDPETGERVCMSCGLVAEKAMNFAENLPFNTTYALTSNLAIDKSLGDTLPDRKLHVVLAKAPTGTKDLPIRSTQIQVIKNAVEPPVIRSMLSYGSRMLKQLGLDRDTDRNHIFADRYGRLLRKLGALIQTGKTDVQPYFVARATLYFLLKKMNPEKAEEAYQRYPFSGKHYKKVVKLIMFEAGEV